MRTRLVLSLAFILSACSGESARTASPAPVQQPVAIEAYGDSTTYGTTIVAGRVARADRPAPAILQELLRAQGQSVTIDNHGVPGSTAAVLLTGFGDNLPWAQQMAKSSAAVVYINFGINDADDRGAETTETFRAALREIVRVARAARKVVVIESPNPAGDAHYTRLADFAQVTRDVAAETGSALVDEYAALSVMDWRSMMSDAIQVHPTQDGYATKAQIELPVMLGVLGGLRH